jgi:hypothetical protein
MEPFSPAVGQAFGDHGHHGAFRGGQRRPAGARPVEAGEAQLTDVLQEAGFGRVRRAAETPFDMVLEARR